MANENITWQTAPSGYALCIHSDCPRAAHCLRAIAMCVLPDDVKRVTIINPNTCPKTDDCRHYKSDEPVRYARGFTRLQQELLPRQYDRFMHRLVSVFGRNEYFRRRRGERPMPPAEHQFIRKVLQEIGASAELEFDSYETNTAWWD